MFRNKKENHLVLQVYFSIHFYKCLKCSVVA